MRDTYSDFCKQAHDGIGRLEKREPDWRDAALLKALAHHLDVRFSVSVSGRHLRMAQPRLNRDHIDTGLQQVHGQRVPQAVRRYLPPAHASARQAGTCDGAAKDMCTTEAGQTIALGIHEHR